MWSRRKEFLIILLKHLNNSGKMMIGSDCDSVTMNVFLPHFLVLLKRLLLSLSDCSLCEIISDKDGKMDDCQ